MSLVIVGSVAFDTIRTPWGDREKIVGGSGTYCSLAASYFTRPRVIGIIGRDFPRRTLALLKSRGVDLEGLRMKAGRTFHWEGRYDADPNKRTTVRTELNVFADFRPSVPTRYRGSRIVYLANLDPERHGFILGQFPSRPWWPWTPSGFGSTRGGRPCSGSSAGSTSSSPTTRRPA
jgi:hypothetical protein